MEMGKCPAREGIPSASQTTASSQERPEPWHPGNAAFPSEVVAENERVDLSPTSGTQWGCRIKRVRGPVGSGQVSCGHSADADSERAANRPE